MSGQSVLVTYAAPQTFLFSESWKQILAALRAQLPLRNIHWKRSSRQSLRTIQELNVDLLPLDAVRGENTSQIPATVLDKPLLNLFIITCEVNISSSWSTAMLLTDCASKGSRDLSQRCQETDQRLALNHHAA